MVSCKGMIVHGLACVVLATVVLTLDPLDMLDNSGSSMSRDMNKDDVIPSFPKRGWNDLQAGGWGKRGWNNLKGAWGKRNSPFDHPEVDSPPLFMDKRPEWSKFKGSWGKRAETPERNNYLWDSS